MEYAGLILMFVSVSILTIFACIGAVKLINAMARDGEYFLLTVFISLIMFLIGGILYLNGGK